jgi:hypothetical protein
MFLQLWSGSRTPEYRAVRDRRRRKRDYRPGINSLDERCLLSANVVTHFDQAVRAPVGAGAAPAQVAFIIPSPNPAPSGGVEKAASQPLSHNPGASSSATIGGNASASSSLASSTGPTFSEITQVSPSLFAAPLTTTAPPAASAPPTPQSSVTPFGPSSAPAPAPFAGQALLVSQKQVLWSAHLGQEDDVGDSEATGSAVDEKNQKEPFIEIIEKPKAAAPAKAHEQRPVPAPAPKPVPILVDESLESVPDILDYGLLTTSFETGSSRPESAPEEPYSSPGFWAMLSAAALSAAALPLAIPVPRLSLWRRVERRQHSKLPDLSKAKASRTERERLSLLS